VDVRLVAATNRDLETMMENREFRSDLYYRRKVFPIRIPPLRERPQDIPLLVRYFTALQAPVAELGNNGWNTPQAGTREAMNTMKFSAS
jgi:transcriptional regulator with GAF, ATPase, and Fis domain